MNMTMRPCEIRRARPRPELVAETVDLAAMRRRAAAWDDLLRRAAYPNAFHSARVMTVHADHGLVDPRVRFILVRRGEELLASLPFHPKGGWTGLRKSHLVWASPFIVLNATPLVARDALDEAVPALLDAMGKVEGSALWRFPYLSLDSAPAAAFAQELRRRGWQSEVVSAYDRAVLNRRPAYEEYAAAVYSPNRRKGLRRLRRRLGELGQLRYRRILEPEALPAAVEAFLALEAQGWKGARGTAMADRPDTAGLMRDLMTTTIGPVTGQADVLELDGRPIAVSLALHCAGVALLVKTAYDESLSRFAPGLVLEDSIIRALHDEGIAERLDSVSVPGCVLEEFFADREPIGELVIAADADVSMLALQRVVRQHRWRRAAGRHARALFWRWRDFKAGALASTEPRRPS